MPYGIKVVKIIEKIVDNNIPEGFDVHCMASETDNLTELFSTFRGYKGKITPENEDACKLFAEEFKAKTLQAKKFIDNKEELPEELRAYEGKIK